MAGIAAAGDLAPDFSLPSPSGEVGLAALRGRKVVVVFYPKADTPGCTREAVDFNRLHKNFEASGAAIVGVSADSVDAQEKFATKHGIRFALTSDPEHRAIAAYGVWAEKQMYGRKFMGIVRSTFLIDEDGRIAKVWRNVRVPGHAEEVLAAVRDL